MSPQRTVIASTVLAFAVGLVAGAVGCATGSGDHSPPQEVVGEPPAEDDVDSEFALPPSHPGEHGQVGGDSPAVEPSAEPGVVTETELQRLQQFGPSVVMQHVETAPAHEDDEFVGFEIVGVSETARGYIESKLQPGDVVTHVNLVRLERPDDYMEAWDTLEDAEQIRFDVVRDGEDAEVILEVE